MIGELLDKWHLRWSRRTAEAAERVDKAFQDVAATNQEVRRAAYDHVDSENFVRTTVGAVLDKMERRELPSDDKSSKVR